MPVVAIEISSHIGGQMKSHSFSIKEGGAAEMSVEVLHGDSGPVILLVASTTRGANLIIRIIVKRLRLGEADAPPG